MENESSSPLMPSCGRRVSLNVFYSLCVSERGRPHTRVRCAAALVFLCWCNRGADAPRLHQHKHGFAALAAPHTNGFAALAAPYTNGFAALAAPYTNGFAALAAPYTNGFAALAAPYTNGFAALAAPYTNGFAALVFMLVHGARMRAPCTNIKTSAAAQRTRVWGRPRVPTVSNKSQTHS
ncbi:hypothetical protein KDAU_21940 [Dictyobacter aurantiacus]|uniref:Uncharacterized protein n=1 Tax=Dictyobacter aurantiacus TaxID=1936993 RepID=A0A401ZDD7_9CHLR|nr:hypothetical protein KDAU_21940 [Dictyobacter aurantiacus]